MNSDKRYGVGDLVRVEITYPDGSHLRWHVGRVMSITPEEYEGQQVLATSLSEKEDGTGDRRKFFYEKCELVRRRDDENGGAQ